MAKLPVVLLLLIFPAFLNNGDALIPDGLSKLFGSLATIKSVRIPELLNQLCNESQGANVMLRDACYGCFYRASNQPTGYPLLLAMSACADMYLNNTDYGHCQAYLRNATNNLNNRVGPVTIYCTFLECIRQVNKDTLDALRAAIREGGATTSREARRTNPGFVVKIYPRTLRAVCVFREQKADSITVRPGAEPIDPRTLRECVGEALRIFPNFDLTDVKLSQLLVNATACVLAKTRCAYTNPITGEIQEDDLANKFHLPSVNAILVNTDYDINIVQFPFRYGAADVCAKFRNVEPAAWPSVAC
ncbi:hypothetical protein HZH66_000029 [Vespula vulgaris]|uniref:Uncharacterized protein n=1 Tax=Vespula vulgaris TaxID=7454 RepID=A0A834KQK3_VESVU|nr:hypothetical protein HZH66_000029 [Vespula vulgaris]